MGALKMKRLRSYEFAMTSAILGVVSAVVALFSCDLCYCPLGLASGIWAFVVLADTQVKSAFGTCVPTPGRGNEEQTRGVG